MIVTFQKMFCEHCRKERNHEVLVTPCCVVCNEYNMGYVAPAPTQNDSATTEPFEIERF